MSLIIVCPERDTGSWLREFRSSRPDLRVEIYPEVAKPDEVEFALSWRHPHGVFNQYPNLKCISAMGAGVDHLLNDPDLPPNATIVRLVDDLLASDMYEFVLAVIMNQLRDLSGYQAQQGSRLWKPHKYERMKDHCVGIMGIGIIGGLVATRLIQSGFEVVGWARSPKDIVGLTVFHGEAQLTEFLSRSNFLVCLLPLTKQTRGILNKSNFKFLPPNAYLINAGRGEHLVEKDLIQSIDEGILSGATLDVFGEEPLPPDYPFWTHKKIMITPHIASVTNPKSCVKQILENYDHMKKGEPLSNVVSRNKGY